MKGPSLTHRPIGYWLKRADTLLTSRVDAAQQGNGLSRLDWQVLNVVRDAGAASSGNVAAVLQPFADEARLSEAVNGLESRSLLQRDEGGAYALTRAGTDVYEKALAAQQTVRRQAMAGITEEDYQTAVAVLERLVGNLEGDDLVAS